MAKGKQPVFEKPEEPDFIKRLKQGFTEVEERDERPLTEAPAREDELPTIVNTLDKEDIDKVREMHGLQPTDEGSEISSEQKHIPAQRSQQIAGLGSIGSDIKKRKRLADLRAKNEAIHVEPSSEPDAKAQGARKPSEDSPAKRPAGRRKKMKIDMTYDDE